MPGALPAVIDSLQMPRDQSAALLGALLRVRQTTRELAAPLSPEDQTVQSMPLASPTKWHLAHTSWFFERFVLGPFAPGYRVFDARFEYLFNSYYDAVGERVPQAERGLLSRPTVGEILAYRDHVDRALSGLKAPFAEDLEARLQLGLQHEQQHQELLLTDALHLLSLSPLEPAYEPRRVQPAGAHEASPSDARWCRHPGGLVEIGQAPVQRGGLDGAFVFDNETPRHRVYLEPFELGERLVNNGEFAEFIEAGGYREPRYWLSEGFAAARREGWSHPLHWRAGPSGFEQFTLAGRLPLDPRAPVCHLSYYEADAFARWRCEREPGVRLPSEAEWELVCGALPVDAGALGSLEAQLPCPRAPAAPLPFGDAFGQVWQWTQSPYQAYPGFVALPGALGEYNAKFMTQQMVLRGSSIATPRSHARGSYRNFFPPQVRWQFTGLRLARS